jgi:hypothetical protein
VYSAPSLGQGKAEVFVFFTLKATGRSTTLCVAAAAGDAEVARLSPTEQIATLTARCAS